MFVGMSVRVKKDRADEEKFGRKQVVRQTMKNLATAR